MSDPIWLRRLDSVLSSKRAKHTASKLRLADPSPSSMSDGCTLSSRSKDAFTESLTRCAFVSYTQFGRRCSPPYWGIGTKRRYGVVSGCSGCPKAIIPEGHQPSPPLSRRHGLRIGSQAPPAEAAFLKQNLAEAEFDQKVTNAVSAWTLIAEPLFANRLASLAIRVVVGTSYPLASDPVRKITTIPNILRRCSVVVVARVSNLLGRVW
jgi:hypothetical protein